MAERSSRKQYTWGEIESAVAEILAADLKMQTAVLNAQTKQLNKQTGLILDEGPGQQWLLSEDGSKTKYVEKRTWKQWFEKQLDQVAGLATNLSPHQVTKKDVKTQLQNFVLEDLKLPKGTKYESLSSKELEKPIIKSKLLEGFKKATQKLCKALGLNKESKKLVVEQAQFTGTIINGKLPPTATEARKTLDEANRKRAIAAQERAMKEVRKKVLGEIGLSPTEKAEARRRFANVAPQGLAAITELLAEKDVTRSLDRTETIATLPKKRAGASAGVGPRPRGQAR